MSAQAGFDPRLSNAFRQSLFPLIIETGAIKKICRAIFRHIAYAGALWPEQLRFGHPFAIGDRNGQKRKASKESEAEKRDANSQPARLGCTESQGWRRQACTQFHAGPQAHRKRVCEGSVTLRIKGKVAALFSMAVKRHIQTPTCRRPALIRSVLAQCGVVQAEIRFAERWASI